MKAAGIELDRLTQILGAVPEVNRVGLSMAPMIGLPRGFQPELVSRLAGMGALPGLARRRLPHMIDPTAAALPPMPPRRWHCPGCTCFQNEEP